MVDKVKWGVLGVANIAVRKVIPAMQLGQWSQITAIASRDLAKAKSAAEQLKIPKAYGSYAEIIADPEIEAIYNPLPNNLHVEWTTKAAQAGKHVLCEKPIGMNTDEARQLLRVSDETGVKIEEAFMVISSPQWVSVMERIGAGEIGEVRVVEGHFSYNNQDLNNIRNKPETGGGGLMDIGCYLIFFSRLVFGAEPKRVVSLVEKHPESQTDILTSALLDFPTGHATFTCSTRITPFQRVQILGTKGRIEVPIPANAPNDQPCKIFIDDGADVLGSGVRTIEFETNDQYTIQGDLFSQAIREKKAPILPLEESIKNMAVIDAVLRSAKSKNWEVPM